MSRGEIESERGESNAIPFLIMTALVFAIVSAVLYFAFEPRNVLSVEDATRLVTIALNTQGATTVGFHTGLVQERPGESPDDPRYRLLEEAGVLTIGHPAGSRTPVALTERGSELLSGIAGVRHAKDPDGTTAFVVPLAARKLIDISSISMENPERAIIEYTWEWNPNALGESFDRLGPAMTFMSDEDRLEMVNKFEARYYHAVPKREVIRATKSAGAWRLAPR